MLCTLQDPADKLSLGEYMFVSEPVKSKTGKTNIFDITSAHSGDLLGQVKWFGRWRCYAFHPEPETVFNGSCMRELVAFCEAVTKEHRSK